MTRKKQFGYCTGYYGIYDFIENKEQARIETKREKQIRRCKGLGDRVPRL